MIKKSFELRFGDIRYILKSSEENQSIQAYYTNIYTYQIFKWSLSINPSDYKDKLKIENSDELDWIQIHSILENIFTKEYRATFSVDGNNSTLFIKCYEPEVQELLGEFVIEIPKTKVKSVSDKFNHLEQMIRGEIEGPLNKIGTKLLSKIQRLSIIFSESQLLTSFLSNENNKLKKDNEVLKYQVENLEKEFMSHQTGQDKFKEMKEEVSELDKEEDNIQIIEKEENFQILENEENEDKEDEDYSVEEFEKKKSPKKKEDQVKDVQLEMLKMMKKQVEKLDEINHQMHYNQSLLEKELKLKKKMKKERDLRKELKKTRIRGMENSALQPKEMLVLKNFLREAGVLKESTTVNCIYVASKNGYSAGDFHRCCDYKPKTIVLIKANNYFFGGYTPCSWGSKRGWVENKDTFIFSLSNPSNTPVRMVCKNPQKSIYDFTSFGPIFGGGSDIYIADNCNQNSNSYSDLGQTFEGCPYLYSSLEAKDFLCGSSNFKVQEIEVYQVFDN